MAKKDIKKKLTIDDIARLAEVSKTTVSRVINHKYEGMTLETRNRVLQVIKENNYRPSNIARSLKNKSSRLIAFIASDLDTDFSTEMMHAMLEVVLDTHHHIIFWTSNNSVEKERTLIESLLDQGVEAIILKPVSNDISYLRSLNINVPLILFNNTFKSNEHDLVKIDFMKVLENGLSHVLENGYDDVYLLMEDSIDDYSKNITENIFNNQISLINKDNNNFNGKIVYTDISKKDNLRNSLKEIVLHNPRNAVVFAASGKILINTAIVIKSLLEEMVFDLGIAGYDDLGVYKEFSWTQLSPKTITRAVPNWYEIGLQIMLLVQERLNDLSGPKKVIEVDTKYYEGESTGKIFKFTTNF